MWSDGKATVFGKELLKVYHFINAEEVKNKYFKQRRSKFTILTELLGIFFFCDKIIM